MTVFVLVFNILSNVFGVVNNFWLADWSNAAGRVLTDDRNETFNSVTGCDVASSV